MSKTITSSLILAAGLLAFAAQEAWADTDYTGTPTPIFPIPGAGIPSVTQVPGKEYAYLTAAGPNLSVAGAPTTNPPPYVLDAGQSQIFDGVGGDDDSIDFSATTRCLDAMASPFDALFHEVIFGGAALLVSQEGDVSSPAAIPIKSESIGGGIATWATWADVDGEAAGGAGLAMPGEFEGLEVWGLDGLAGADTDRVSFVGDAALGFSVFAAGGTVGLVPQSFIATILMTDAAFEQFGPPTVAWAGTPSEIDVDGLMFLDDGVAGFSPSTDSLIFSVRPTSSSTTFNFDGGEIMVWAPALGYIGYLFHGGHFWDTPFGVASTLGPDGLRENIDGLEAVAVPEPATAAMAAIACMGMLRFRRRRV